MNEGIQDIIYNTSIESDEVIETEDVGAEIISVPFNPSSIKIRRDPFTLGQLVDKIRYDEVAFNTPYQRKSDLWDETAQSRLIESIMLKLPLPSFYFDETDSVRQLWNVIDGLQRCSAFKNFIIDQSLRLTNLEFLGDLYNNKTFSGLPKELQRRIMQTPITTIVIEAGTPDLVKFNIFKRINTGGLILTPQEIRHAMNIGVPTQIVDKLANETSFKKATCNQILSERMEDQDFITRFVSFYLIDTRDYTPDLDTFMNKGMAAIKNLSQIQIDEMCNSFIRSMETIYAIWGDDSFRKRKDPCARRCPLNKSLFEIMSVGFAKITQQECDKLKLDSAHARQAFIELNNDNKFFNSITSGTGNKECVVTRHSMFTSFLQNLLNS